MFELEYLFEKYKDLADVLKQKYGDYKGLLSVGETPQLILEKMHNEIESIELELAQIRLDIRKLRTKI